jgi:hypothetical protein
LIQHSRLIQVNAFSLQQAPYPTDPVLPGVKEQGDHYSLISRPFTSLILFLMPPYSLDFPVSYGVSKTILYCKFASDLSGGMRDALPLGFKIKGLTDQRVLTGKAFFVCFMG